MAFYKIKVQTEVKKPFFEEKSADTFFVGLREKKERNLANRALIILLQKKFSGKRIKIVSGLKSQSKIVEIKVPRGKV